MCVGQDDRYDSCPLPHQSLAPAATYISLSCRSIRRFFPPPHPSLVPARASVACACSSICHLCLLQHLLLVLTSSSVACASSSSRRIRRLFPPLHLSPDCASTQTTALLRRSRSTCAGLECSVIKLFTGGVGSDLIDCKPWSAQRAPFLFSEWQCQ